MKSPLPTQILAARESTEPPTIPSRTPTSFDVTCTIGTIQTGPGTDPPHVAAFKLIGEHDKPGTYTFQPVKNGTTMTVIVHHTYPG